MKRSPIPIAINVPRGTGWGVISWDFSLTNAIPASLYLEPDLNAMLADASPKTVEIRIVLQSGERTQGPKDGEERFAYELVAGSLQHAAKLILEAARRRKR